MNLVYKSVLSILIVALTILFVIFFINGSSFSENIIPELIGFTLEGIFFVILFTYFEKNHNKQIIKKSKLDLKKRLISLLNLILYWSKPISVDIVFGEMNKINDITKIYEQLLKNKRLDGVSSHFLKEHAALRINSIQATLPIAAQIDGEHLFYWDMILSNLSFITRSKDDEELYDALIFMLDWMIQFINLEIE